MTLLPYPFSNAGAASGVGDTVNPSDGVRNSHSDRFDVRFLARPAIEEGFSPLTARRRLQRLELIL